MPYLEQGEFYNAFGNFDVRITIPKNYVWPQQVNCKPRGEAMATVKK
jgi:hypothetical protein